MDLVYVDIDGVLCVSEVKTDGEYDYNYSIPIQKNIDKVNRLFETKEIVIYTARGNRTGKIDWRMFTIEQLKKWGVKYHRIDFTKPHFDLLIDDKTLNSFDSIIV